MQPMLKVRKDFPAYRSAYRCDLRRNKLHKEQPKLQMVRLDWRVGGVDTEKLW